MDYVHTLKNAEEILSIPNKILGKNPGKWIFRGQSRDDSLMPTAWRKNIPSEYPLEKLMGDDLLTFLDKKIDEQFPENDFQGDQKDTHFTSFNDFKRRIKNLYHHSLREMYLVHHFLIEANHAGLYLPEEILPFGDLFKKEVLSSWCNHFKKALERHNCKIFFLESINRIKHNTSTFKSGVTPPIIHKTLALAQHHGLPTRLLDWTMNFFKAAFFATNNKDSSDAIIWALKADALPGDKVCIIKDLPNHEHKFLHVQEGLFTFIYDADKYFFLHGDWPALENTLKPDITKNDIAKKIIIPSHFREEITEIIKTLGVKRSTLMPSYDNVITGIRENLKTKENGAAASFARNDFHLPIGSV